MIKKLFPLLLITTCLTACNNGSSESSEPIADLTNEIKELDNFFNTQKVDFTMKYSINNVITPVISFYSDEEKIVQKSTKRSDLKEITMKDKSLLDGDGFKVYIEKDNSSLFVPSTYVDVNPYISVIDYDTYSDRVLFNLDLKGYSSGSALLSGEEFDSFFNELGITVDHVPMLVKYMNGKIYSVTMILDNYMEELGSLVPVSIIYTINSYGDSLKRIDINTNEFLKVDEKAYKYVEMDFASLIEHGEGYSFRERISSYDYFINEVPEDEVIFECYNYYDHNYDLEVTFSMTDHKEENGVMTCTYSFAGRILTCSFNVFKVTYLNIKDEVNFEVNHKEEDPIAYDYDNNRVIFKADNKVVVLDIATLSIIKEYEVEGDITMVMCHDNVYHIMTVTDNPRSGYYNDEDCRGNIYVVDKATLEIAEPIHVNTYPYYTAIDKRGDILIVPGSGQWCPVYLYNTTTGECRATGGTYQIYDSSYIVYEEDNDRFICVETKTSAKRPAFYDYVNGDYVCDYYHQVDESEAAGYLRIDLFYKNYAISKYSFVDFTNWDAPKASSYVSFADYIAKQVAFADASKDIIYSVQQDREQKMIIVGINIKDGSKKTYMIDQKANNITFGFVKDGSIYVYDNVEKAFYTVDVNA